MLNWGLLATGLIARRFAAGVAASQSGQLVAVGSRTQQSADALADEFNIAARYASYEALLADSNVHAVYISTPHPMHAEWAIKAAEAGKHILVEKPIGLNYYEAMAMFDAARVNDVFLMEAFMYRCHPQMAKVCELVGEGAIGQLQLIQAAFSYRTDAGPESRFFAQELGGGGILDVGCYPVSLARLAAGAALGKGFAEPLQVKGCGHLGATGVDEWAIASLQFENDIVAQVSTGLRLNQHHDNTAKLFGTEGTLFIPEPWVPGPWLADKGGSNSEREAGARMLLQRHDESEPREIFVPSPHNLYTYEADTVAAHIAARQAPAMNWDDSLGNMRALDSWRRELGLLYDAERPENYKHTISRRPLRVRADVKMPYGRIEGLDKPLSRLVMGADSNNTMADTAIMFDDYFERGGNVFDTSHAYGNPNGATERNLGQWVNNRSIRDQVVVIEKGANYPFNTPAGLTKELVSGLERLGLEYADIYMIHRDNIEVPVGEWMDALAQNFNAGRMKAYGVSNFTLPRLQAMQEYAAKNGLPPLRALSNNFSLARMLSPVWELCVSSSDDEFREWHTATQMPLLPWSSQARGFFTPYAAPDKLGKPELVRCWYSPENWQRRARAAELAEKLDVEPINIALAYVLAQPFPTFPLIGPKQLSETRSCLRALDIELSQEQCAWLDLRSEARGNKLP